MESVEWLSDKRKKSSKREQKFSKIFGFRKFRKIDYVNINIAITPNSYNITAKISILNKC